MQTHYIFQFPRLLTALFLTLILGTSSKNVHPFHVSVTEIRTNSTQKTVQISCRMFTDDLQSALFHLYQYKAELAKTDGTADAYLQRYLKEHLQISIGGQVVDYQWVGYEIEEEATWCYLEASNVPTQGQAQVTSRILYDYLSEQTNLIHYYRDGVRSSYKLVNPAQSATF